MTIVDGSCQRQYDASDVAGRKRRFFYHLLSRKQKGRVKFFEMKVFFGCLVFFILTSGKIYAQPASRDFFRFDSLPAGGVLLDKGWTFYPADDSQWARQGYSAPGEKPH